MDSNETFQIEQQGETVIITPLITLRELAYERIERDAQHVSDQLAAASTKNVIVDMSQTEYYGSTALGVFFRFWKQADSQAGQLVFCNLAPYGREVLELTRLNTLWAICQSREEALAVVSSEGS